MARLYKIDDSEPMTGAKLVETTLTIFNASEQGRCGRGNCSHPRTVRKAQWFLAKFNKKVYTKKDAETKWSLME